MMSGKVMEIVNARSVKKDGACDDEVCDGCDDEG